MYSTEIVRPWNAPPIRALLRPYDFAEAAHFGSSRLVL
jgi:hypothetical protein